MRTLLDPGYAASIGIPNEANSISFAAKNAGGLWRNAHRGYSGGADRLPPRLFPIVAAFVRPVRGFTYLGLSGKEIGSMTFVACFLVGIVVNNDCFADHLRKRVARMCRSEQRVMRALAGASVVVCTILLTSNHHLRHSTDGALPGANRWSTINELGDGCSGSCISHGFTLFVVPLVIIGLVVFAHGFLTNKDHQLEAHDHSFCCLHRTRCFSVGSATGQRRAAAFG